MYTPSSTEHSTDTFSKPGLPDQSQNTEEKDFQGNIYKTMLRQFLIGFQSSLQLLNEQHTFIIQAF